MQRSESLPRSITQLLEAFRPCFSTRGFATFTALITVLIGAPARRTVCGMLAASGKGTSWHHSRAHRFFATTRWNLDRVGLVVLGLVIGWLVPAAAPVVMAVDDTLFRRRGRKVHAACWAYDGSRQVAKGQQKLSHGNEIGTSDQLTTMTPGQSTTVTRCGRTRTVTLHERRCLWYGVFRSRPVRVIVVREPHRPTLALVTTDPHTPAVVVLTGDRDAALARFARSVSESDAQTLTRELGCHLEPSQRLPLSGLRQLLGGKDHRAVPRQRLVRPNPAPPGPARCPVALAETTPSVRQLHVRPVPQPDPRRVHRPGVRRHGPRHPSTPTKY